MTYRLEPDGTRVYPKGRRYKPVPPAQRKYGVRRPDDPRAVRFRGEWLLPLPLIPEALRSLPATRADSEAYDHMPGPCRCAVCCRGPEIVGRWRRLWEKEKNSEKR